MLSLVTRRGFNRTTRGISIRSQKKRAVAGCAHTGVRKDSATNRALALSCIGLATSQYQGREVVRERETYEELHLGNLLVDLLHELDDEVDELVLQQLLGVEVSNQEGNVVALRQLAHGFFQYSSSFSILLPLGNSTPLLLSKPPT